MKKRFGQGELHLALLALIGTRPMHGYELMNELGSRMRRYKPSPGSIYPAVAALEADGLIESSDDSYRKTYAITTSGRHALSSRAGDLARMEDEHGVRFGERSADAVLAQFTQRARPLADGLDLDVLENTLNDTIASLTRLAKGEAHD